MWTPRDKYLVFDNPDWLWWSQKSRDGYLNFLFEEGYPVKVLHGRRVIYFGEGLTAAKVSALMRELYGKMLSGRE